MRIHNAQINNLKPTTMFQEIQDQLIAGIPVQIEVKDEQGNVTEHNYASSNLQQIIVELRRTYPNQLIDARINQLGLNYATLAIAC